MYRLNEHLEKLKQFEATARLGNISYAAKSLNISQAAVSRSIKVLEDILETRLLIRKQAGIELTNEGNTLFKFSKNILSQSIEIEKIIKNENQNYQSQIRVGTHEALAIHFWPTFLKRLSKTAPHLKISLTSGRIDDLVHGLLNHHYDFLLSVEPLPHIKIHTEIFNKTPLVFLGTKEFKNTLTASELNEITILTDTSSHSKQGLPMNSFLVNQGLELKNVFELNSFEAAIKLAEQGLGIAVLPRTIAENANIKALKEIKVKTISSKNFGEHKICISYLKSDQSKAIQTLANSCLKLKQN